MVNELYPIQQAYKEIPKAWYETQSIGEYWAKFLPTTIGAITATSIGSYYLHNEFPNFFANYSYAPGLTAATIYAISAIVDQRSTVKAFQNAQMAKAEGIQGIDIKDASITLTNIKSADEIKKSKINIVVQTALVIASAFNPEIGLALAGVKLLATAGNRRLGHRYIRAIEINRRPKN